MIYTWIQFVWKDDLKFKICTWLQLESGSYSFKVKCTVMTEPTELQKSVHMQQLFNPDALLQLWSVPYRVAWQAYRKTVCATGRGWPSPREDPQPSDSPLWRKTESIGPWDKSQRAPLTSNSGVKFVKG
jgi:hypothetical protein